ncbi:P-loop NTPase fold protein [Serratia sp. Tan611]|uniref:KAP family P-loop NTPase fold protein n=1 Tax=Serratia sp. Tan611 TaxID=2773264 RepID=UPI0019313226|nr:P-loop NTPase fold protein [Serratia sp. Tan611]CAE1145016.1 KAP NTPase domain-containing protein [Serratia sp. Tan611]
MRLTAPEKKFNDGFSEEHDTFHRKKLHDIIIRVATNAPDKSLVLALDDKWGNGKTSFVKMMCSEINKNHSEQLDVIYFDAFESDYQSDPFVALTSKIYELIKKDEGKLKSLGERLISLGKKLGASFAINGAKLTVSALTGGLVSGTSVEKAKDAIVDSITAPIESYVEEKIKNSENELATIENFGSLLTEIHKESGRKIIFIIDELDRARPDFSLELLEKVKHIFSVEGFVFLLVINREQFEKSIECRYGNINSRLYLNKFIHYWFTLPKENLISSSRLLGYEKSTIMRHLFSLDVGNNLFSRSGCLVKTISYLLELNGGSLREAERCYSVFAVMIDPGEINRYRHEFLFVAIGLVVFLKVHNPSLLIDIKNKVINVDDVLSQLSINESMHDIHEFYYLKDILDYHYLDDSELASSENRERFSYISGVTGRRVRWLDTMYEQVEGFTVG